MDGVRDGVGHPDEVPRRRPPPVDELTVERRLHRLEGIRGMPRTSPNTSTQPAPLRVEVRRPRQMVTTYLDPMDDLRVEVAPPRRNVSQYLHPRGTHRVEVTPPRQNVSQYLHPRGTAPSRGTTTPSDGHHIPRPSRHRSESR
ncbi:hypothetical protein BN12_120017 [Nostocoides japonicum T1-X7]|uniref:Uncharacterized protein n=1 Tax=Nostocoides japonicum T1-X7 TaxID=1194083 RepID=A0A077LWN7_9MICO|nr:hypothetical protein BN12_120017 [Tetrasphaera japonica T1-X7]